MPKIVNTALKAKAKAKAKAWTFEAKAKAKAIKFGLEAPRGQGLASRTTSLMLLPLTSYHIETPPTTTNVHVAVFDNALPISRHSTGGDTIWQQVPAKRFNSTQIYFVFNSNLAI